MVKSFAQTLRLMAISKESEFALIEALDQLSKTDIDCVYVVDSYGALYCEQIEYLVKLYQEHVPGKEIGIHAHNNQQLAFSNTVEAIIHNANYLDASLFGIGRGPGNCCLELLVGFLKNPKFNLSPILKFIQDYMLPLREKIEWGYIIPYMLTGILNEHPRAAIAYRDSEDRDKYSKGLNSRSRLDTSVGSAVPRIRRNRPRTHDRRRIGVVPRPYFLAMRPRSLYGDCNLRQQIDGRLSGLPSVLLSREFGSVAQSVEQRTFNA